MVAICQPLLHNSVTYVTVCHAGWGLHHLTKQPTGRSPVPHGLPCWPRAVCCSGTACFCPSRSTHVLLQHRVYSGQGLSYTTSAGVQQKYYMLHLLHDGSVESLLLASDSSSNQYLSVHVTTLQIGNLSDYQVNLTTGTGFWGLPQDMPPNRTPLIINASTPAVPPSAAGAGAEVLAAASAALSAASLALKPTQPDFAAAALIEAKVLFDLAEQMQPQINRTLDDLREIVEISSGGSGISGNASAAAAAVGVEVFGSSSVMDDMAFAATWLAKATGRGSAQQLYPSSVVAACASN